MLSVKAYRVSCRRQCPGSFDRVSELWQRWKAGQTLRDIDRLLASMLVQCTALFRQMAGEPRQIVGNHTSETACHAPAAFILPTG